MYSKLKNQPTNQKPHKGHISVKKSQTLKTKETPYKVALMYVLGKFEDYEKLHYKYKLNL